VLPKLLAEIVAAEHAKLWRSSVKLAIVMSLLGMDRYYSLCLGGHRKKVAQYRDFTFQNSTDPKPEFFRKNYSRSVS